MYCGAGCYNAAAFAYTPLKWRNCVGRIENEKKKASRDAYRASRNKSRNGAKKNLDRIIHFRGARARSIRNQKRKNRGEERIKTGTGASDDRETTGCITFYFWTFQKVSCARASKSSKMRAYVCARLARLSGIPEDLERHDAHLLSRFTCLCFARLPRLPRVL